MLGRHREKVEDMKAFKFISPRLALYAFYYPALWGGLVICFILMGINGGFDFFHIPNLTNFGHFFIVLMTAFLSGRAIQDLYKIRNGIKFAKYRSPRKAFILLNAWPIGMWGTIALSLTEWDTHAWAISGISFSIIFILWGIYVEIGCYKNHLIPYGFTKKI